MLCFVFAALVVLLDQLFKRWIVITLAVSEESILIPGVLNLLHVENSGAAFSILPNQRWLLAAIAFIAALVLIAILLRYDEGFWGTLGLASVLGGTIGNFIDRVFHGYVVDMFRTTFMDFAIFNIADIFITLGGITFCVFFIVSSARSANPKEKKAAAPEDAAERPAEPYDTYDYPETREEIDFDKLFYEEPARTGYEEADTAEPPVSYEYDNAQYTQNSFAQNPYSEPEPYAPERDAAFYYEPAPEKPVYYEPVPDPPGDSVPALDALSALEAELSDAVADYDIDDILREYGFENDKD